MAEKICLKYKCLIFRTNFFGKSQTKKKKAPTSIANLKEYPTFFYFQKNIPKMELKDQHVHINSNYSYNLITDVVNDYFTREENKGTFKVLSFFIKLNERFFFIFN